MSDTFDHACDAVDSQYYGQEDPPESWNSDKRDAPDGFYLNIYLKPSECALIAKALKKLTRDKYNSFKLSRLLSNMESYAKIENSDIRKRSSRIANYYVERNLREVIHRTSYKQRKENERKKSDINIDLSKYKITKEVRKELDAEFTFGKHRGRTFEEVLVTEPSYLLWVIRNVERIELSKGFQKVLNSVLKEIEQ